MSYSDYNTLMGLLLAGGLISFYLCGLIFSYAATISAYKRKFAISAVKKSLEIIGALCIFPFLIVILAIIQWRIWPSGWVNVMIGGGSASFVFLLIRAFYAFLGRSVGSGFYFIWFWMLFITNYSFFIIILLRCIIYLIFGVELSLAWL